MTILTSILLYIAQEKKLRKLAKLCGTGSYLMFIYTNYLYIRTTYIHDVNQYFTLVPASLPPTLQNPDTVAPLLKYLKDKDSPEMPALVISWNDAGFNDTPTQDCRNGIAGQTKAAIIASLIAHGAGDFLGLNLIFVFQNCFELSTLGQLFDKKLSMVRDNVIHINMYFRYFGYQLIRFS